MPRVRLAYFALPAAILVGLGGILSLRICGCGQDERAAKLAAAKTDLSNIGNALDQFKLDTGRYPTAAEGLQVLILRPPDTSHGPYFKRLLLDPWGSPYAYDALPNGGYKISSIGPDYAKDTADDLILTREAESVITAVGGH